MPNFRRQKEYKKEGHLTYNRLPRYNCRVARSKAGKAWGTLRLGSILTPH